MCWNGSVKVFCYMAAKELKNKGGRLPRIVRYLQLDPGCGFGKYNQLVSFSQIYLSLKILGMPYF